MKNLFIDFIFVKNIFMKISLNIVNILNVVARYFMLMERQLWGIRFWGEHPVSPPLCER